MCVVLFPAWIWFPIRDPFMMIMMTYSSMCFVAYFIKKEAIDQILLCDWPFLAVIEMLNDTVPFLDSLDIRRCLTSPNGLQVQLIFFTQSLYRQQNQIKATVSYCCLGSHMQNHVWGIKNVKPYSISTVSTFKNSFVYNNGDGFLDRA